MREFFVANAGYWIDEFHLDGLRLDATQPIHDASPTHILAEIGARARARGRRTRPIVIVAENEPQDTRLVRPRDDGGYGLDALWNDDFHHSAMVALTGRAEAYYTDTRGAPQEFDLGGEVRLPVSGAALRLAARARAARRRWGLPPSAFVTFTQNHDQVANSARGLRGHQLTSPARWRAMTALLLLLPATPMLFQGQEFAASAPFLYFADSTSELAAAVRERPRRVPDAVPEHRRDRAQRGALADPGAVETFERCKLDFGRARRRTRAAYALHRDLLRLRREDAGVHTRSGRGRRRRRGAVGGRRSLLRFFTADHRDDRLLVVNLGGDLQRPSFAEPLLAPPPDSDWTLQLVERGPGVRRRRHRRTVPGRAGGTSRRSRRCCSGPVRSRPRRAAARSDTTESHDA